MVKTHKPSNIKLETALLFKDRKVEFTKKETLHSLDFHDIELNKKVPVQIVSQQYSINSEIKIFLDAFVLKNSLPKNTDNIIEFIGLCGINSRDSAHAGFAYGNNIFFNTKKSENLELFLIHELQHAFDYYVGIIPSVVEAHNDSEYRAILAEIVFGKPENTMDKYNNIKQDCILTEMAIDSYLKKNLCAFSRRDFPHSWAHMKILMDLNNLEYEKPLTNNWIKNIIDSRKTDYIIEKSKMLLNNEYRRLTTKSYDELLEELFENARGDN